GEQGGSSSAIVDRGSIVDLGDVALIPGLVNAHTHLEYSQLTAPLGQPGLSFAEWLRQVIARRRAAAERATEEGASRELLAQRAAAVQQGIAESQAAGVVTVGDITSPGWSRAWYAGDLQVTLFQELLGLAASSQTALQNQAAQQLRELPASALTGGELAAAPLLRGGLSPHAPYTVRPDLVQQVCDSSRAASVPVAMHLAESFEELEMLAAHSGRLVEVLSEFGAWEPAAIPRGIRPLQYLQWLSKAWRALVVHGNFLQTPDWQFLAAQRATMSVVYCPRTQAYFAHGDYPLLEQLALGVRVAVGTDSRATNPDLSLWKELQWVRERYPQLAPLEILGLGTQAGAEALGVEQDYGSLLPGRRAKLLVVPLADPIADWQEQLFAGAPTRLL
ncbi:MAG: amidohydrolase family protein, partial [Planctomycetota bacterium]